MWPVYHWGTKSYAPSICFINHALDVGGAELSLLDTMAQWVALLHGGLTQPVSFRGLLCDHAVPPTSVEAGKTSLSSVPASCRF